MRTRKWLLRLHLFAGLTIGLLLALIGVTGSLLVFDTELDARLNPQLLRTTAPQGAQQSHASPDEVLDRVAQSYPQQTVARIRLPRASDDVYEVCFKARADATCVYVNQYTAEILGERVPDESFKQIVFMLHRKLLSGDTGETIVGIAGVMLLLMSISGIVLWLPRSINLRKLKRAFVVNARNGWRRTAFDLHKVVGVLAFASLSLNAATGAYMVFHKPLDAMMNRIIGSTDAQRPLSSVGSTQENAQPSLDAVVEQSRATLPGAELTFINLPNNATAPIAVRAKLPGELHPNGRSLVYFDARSGNLLRADSALDAPLGTRIANLMYPLHTGRLAGFATRLILVIVGFVPAFLFLSGIAMWWNRIVARRWRRVRGVSAPVLEPSPTEAVASVSLRQPSHERGCA